MDKITHESNESLRIGDGPCWVTFDKSLHLSEPMFSPLQSALSESPLLTVTLHPREEAVCGGSSGGGQCGRGTPSPTITQLLDQSGKGGTGGLG